MVSCILSKNWAGDRKWTTVNKVPTVVQRKLANQIVKAVRSVLIGGSSSVAFWLKIVCLVRPGICQ